jgi:hypothetical protein
MKARNKNIYQALQITREKIAEKGQRSVRAFFPDLTSVEIRGSGLTINTRSKRYDLPLDHWILKDKFGKVAILTDVDFKFNYEIID